MRQLLIFVATLALLSNCGSSNNEQVSNPESINWHGIDTLELSDSIQRVVYDIADYGTYTNSAVGYSAKRPIQWDNYMFLLKNASIYELQALSEFDIPVVRCYAFKALCWKSAEGRFDILLEHLTDSDYVETLNGCMGGRSRVADIFLDEYFWNRWEDDFDNKNLNYVDSIIFFDPKIDLDYEYSLYDNLVLNEENYKRLSDICRVEKNPDALPTLAKYKNEEDTLLIQFWLAQDESYEVNYALKAVSVFPHSSLFKHVKKTQYSELNNDGGYNYQLINSLYEAIVAYKNLESRKLIEYAINNSEGSMLEYHSQGIWLAIMRNESSVYEGIIEKLELSDFFLNQHSSLLRDEE